MRRPGSRLLLALVLTLLGCGDDSPTAGTDTSIEDALPGDTTPDGGDPRFGPCPADLPSARIECATLSREVPGSDSGVSLHITRAPALEPDNRLGVLFVNPGGPGSASGRLVAAMSLLPSYFDISSYFDIVGVDWRGTGHSTPRVACLPDADIDRLQLLDPVLDLAETLGILSRMLADCRAAVGDEVMRTLDVATAARDLDAVREWLEEDKVSFYGASYGTRLGAAYATLFPERTRAMVLDAPVPPEGDLLALINGQTESYDLALEAFFDACGDDPDCAFGGGTGGAAVAAAFDTLVAGLRTAPIPASNDRELTAYDLETTLFLALDQALWEEWAEGLAAARDGDGTALRDMAESTRTLRRREDGSYDSTLEVYMAIMCADLMGAGRPSREDFEAALDAADDAWPRFRGSGRSFLACYDWDLTTSPFVIDAAGAPPALVVGGANDASTPPAWAAQLAAALGNDSRVLMSDHVGHVAWGRGLLEVENRIRDALIDPSRAHDRWSCLETMKPAVAVPGNWSWLDVTAALFPSSFGTRITVSVVRRADGAVLAEQTISANRETRIEYQNGGVAQDLIVRLSAPGYRTTEHHRIARVALNWSIETSLITNDELRRLYGGLSFDTGGGMVVVDGRDCDRKPIAEASFELSPEAGKVLYSRVSQTSGQCTYNAGATRADTCSDAMIFNIPGGTYQPRYRVLDGPWVTGPELVVDGETVHFVTLMP